MVAQGHGGAVVNNASVLGWRAQPGQAHYAAAKAGVIALTRCAALDVAPHGIRVNAVAPAWLSTPSWPRSAARTSSPTWPAAKPSAAPQNPARSPTSSSSWPANTRAT